MATQEQLRQTVRTLLDSQAQGVLATQHDRQPYTSLMAFAVTPDLHWIVFATYRATQKHANLLANPRASLLIDNRTNESADYHDTVATSAQGTVSEVDLTRRGELLQLYLEKHPDLSDFVSATDCVLLKLEVESFYVVSQFQNVAVLQMF
ncbi:MAG: pyridoxamine 5'-phosphate oxidase family protein [Halobacteria archaeon]|nr:pyridoxamine 5'-phosphate oxidase family protein [Halobacteria archaeon]